jgi:hypothetical protein
MLLVHLLTSALCLNDDVDDEDENENEDGNDNYERPVPVAFPSSLCYR